MIEKKFEKTGYSGKLYKSCTVEEFLRLMDISREKEICFDMKEEMGMCGWLELFLVFEVENQKGYEEADKFYTHFDAVALIYNQLEQIRMNEETRKYLSPDEEDENTYEHDEDRFFAYQEITENFGRRFYIVD